MYPFSIGVLMDGFRTDTLTALDKAVAVGATGIQAVSYTHLDVYKRQGV